MSTLDGGRATRIELTTMNGLLYLMSTPEGCDLLDAWCDHRNALLLDVIDNEPVKSTSTTEPKLYQAVKLH